MFISKQGLNLIKQFEGCILSAYDDCNDKVVNSNDNVKGTLTIGYGHVEGVYIGQTISQEQADELLKDDMFKYCREVEEVINSTSIPFQIAQNVFDSFVSFDYNLGQGCLRTLLADGTRDKQTVADMILEYRNKGSQWEEGLLRRRQAEREMFLGSGNTVTSTAIGNVTGNLTGKIAELQEICGITVDGIYGTQTDNAIKNLPLCGLPYIQRELTVWVQLRLGINADGIFGSNTDKAVREWQRVHDLTVDGIVGYNTYKSLALA